MDVLFERCCGLDVHKKLVVACVIITQPRGESLSGSCTALAR